jgi:hypothetical protein
MSLSAVNQYYLQSMDIDLYVERALDTAPQPQPQQRHKQSKITLQELQDSHLIGDICRVLAITPAAIVPLADNQFRFGSLHWVFDAQTQVIGVEQHKLSTPLLADLRETQAKRSLWACLMPLVKEQ